MNDPKGSRLFHTPLIVLLVAVLAAASYHWVPQLDFTGLDAAPLLEANRFDHEGGPLGCFAREIRDGIEPEVAFYRPLTGLSHGFDFWLWGLAPGGHQLTQVILHAAVSVALLALLVALEVPLAGALIAAAWFAVHPLGVEVVPCTARRAELWLSLCLAAACLGWLRRRAHRRLGGTLLVVGGLLAPLAKETGAVLPLLLLALASRGNRRTALIWGVGLVAPALIARTLVLGGLGGYGAWSWQPAALPSSLGDLFDPARIAGVISNRILGSSILLLALFAALRERGPERAVYRLGLVWIVALLLPAALARGISSWYLYAPTMGLAMLLGALFTGQAMRWGLRRRLVVGALVLAVALPAFATSPMAVAYPEWFEVSRQSRTWQELVDELPEEFFDGPQLVAGLPYRVEFPARRGTRVRSASVLTDFSLRAWIRLRRDRDSRPANAALMVILHPAPRYSVQVSWLPSEKTARLRAQGPAILTLYGDEHPFQVRKSPPGELELSDLEAPLWRWNGKALVRVPIPPGKRAIPVTPEVPSP